MIRQYPRMTVAAVAIAAAAAIGGVTAASTSSGKSPSPAVAISGSVMAGRGASTVRTADATVQGKRETILVDPSGLPLYFYRPDSGTSSRVSGQLAVLWPPLRSSAPTGSGVTGRVSSVSTTNGHQVTYNGHFLYTFVEDRPGHVTGQGVQNFFVATPGLDSTPASPTYGYGY